jgi:hypothetical protein
LYLHVPVINQPHQNALGVHILYFGQDVYRTYVYALNVRERRKLRKRFWPEKFKERGYLENLGVDWMMIIIIIVMMMTTTAMMMIMIIIITIIIKFLISNFGLVLNVVCFLWVTPPGNPPDECIQQE